MDFYLGKHVNKYAAKHEKPMDKVEPTDEVLIMLFTNIDLRKLSAMLVINILLKWTMHLTWSDFISLSLMIIMMRHVAIRLAYYLFVGYLVDELMLGILLCGFDFIDIHYDFVGDQFMVNTTWYYLTIAYGTFKGVISSAALLFLNYYLGRDFSVFVVFKQITLCIFMYFIQVLNIKKLRHNADGIFDVNFRKSLYTDPKKLEQIINEYCKIVQGETQKMVKPDNNPRQYSNIELLLYIRAISILISKAEFEDLSSNMSQHFIACFSTLLKAYTILNPKKKEANKVETLWKAEVKKEEKIEFTKLENSKCQVIEGNIQN